MESKLTREALRSLENHRWFSDPRRPDIRQTLTVSGCGLDCVRVSCGCLDHRLDVQTPVPWPIAPDSPNPSSKKGEGAVSIPPPVVNVARPQLRESLEEFFVRRSLGLLPRGLPGLVRGKEPPLVEVIPSEPVILFEGQGIEVLEVEPILRVPRHGPPELVAGPFRLLSGNLALVGDVLVHTSSYRPRGISFANMGRALLTDLYELNMAASYLRRGMTQPATFSLFVRDLPDGWGFLVACGLDRCLEFLESFRFEEEDLAYLSEIEGYTDETLDSFRSLRFEGEVRAVPEGRLVFADEPVLEVTAPLPQAQLVETYLLNQITYQTAVCSKAARCKIAAADRDLIDFSFRRVHGAEASLAVARATAIAGFEATSNVEAARVLGLTAAGTMAHSYIEAFGSEIEAFRAFAEDFPNRVVLLVDTYDTSRGVEKAIEIAEELSGRGSRLLGIRLDSGDLAELSRSARRRLNEAGLQDVRILVSGSLDEHKIAALGDAPIDAFGVGTRVGVAADAPYLDSVYKLVEFDGRPVAKLSTGKATLPGPKQVWRRSEMDGDVIALRDEEGPVGAEPLLTQVMADGRRLIDEGIEEPRLRFAEELRLLPMTLGSLEPGRYPVERSSALEELAESVRSSIRERELG